MHAMLKNAYTNIRNLLKKYRQNYAPTPPKETQPCSRLHMDHAQINSVRLCFILVDSFSGWSEVAAFTMEKLVHRGKYYE